LKPQLHKHAPACAGFKNLDFSLVRAGGLCFYSREFHSPGLKAFCPDLVQKWLTLIVVLLFVLGAIFFYGKPQLL
jgi:hypothetical protein